MEKEFEVKFLYASSPRQYIVKRVNMFDSANKEYEEIKNFVDKEDRDSEIEYKKTGKKPDSTFHAEMICSKHNILTAMIEPFWDFFSKEEKLNIIKIAAKQYGHFEFDEFKEFGLEEDTISPIYSDGTTLSFNTTALDYKIDGCTFLTAILSAQTDLKQQQYENTVRVPKNILELENIQELKTRYVFSEFSADTNLSEEAKDNWLECWYADMPAIRARNYSYLDAIDMCITEAEQFKPMTNAYINKLADILINQHLSNLRTIHSTLNIMHDGIDEELAKIQQLEGAHNEHPKQYGFLDYVDDIREILVAADRKRDAWYVIEVNSLINQQAQQEGRLHDITDDITALKHFGLSEKDLDKEEDNTEENEDDEFDNDGIQPGMA